MTNKITVLKTAYKNLEGLIKTKAEALPKDFNKTRFLQNCMTVLNDTVGIEKMQPQSIARTMLKGAFLGLDFFNKECYAIPYGNNLQFQTDYKGEIKLAKKYSINKIVDIYAKLVREGDVFEEVIIDGKQSINFKPKPFSNAEIIGVFAVCYYADGSMLTETMSIDEVNHIRDNFSKVSKGKAWTNSFGEMCRKTVLRRLTKHIQLDFEHAEQDKAWDDASEFEFGNTQISGKPIVALPKQKTEFVNQTEEENKPPETEEENTETNNEENQSQYISEQQRKRFFAIGKEIFKDDELKKFLKDKFNIESSKEIPTDKYEEIILSLEALKNV